MTNLEKLTSGDIAVRNNGTLEQFQEVYAHCFPESYGVPYGNWEFFEKDKGRVKHTDLPVINITQLWEELQALKKPEIWWIRVTEENKDVVSSWLGITLDNDWRKIAGLYADKRGEIKKGFNFNGVTKTDYLDFGNEIDFTTFLKYTGVEPEKVEKGEKCTCETCNPNKPEKVEKSLDDKLNEIDLLREKLKTFNERIKDNRAKYEQIEQLSNDYLFLKTKTLLQYSDLKRIILVGLNEDHKVFQSQLTEINTKISALLK